MEPRSHLFDVGIAREYGVNAAIFLEHLRFWIHKNQANKSKAHYRDGRWWTWNSAPALTKIFPYWTARQIRRIVNSLEEQGAIVTGQFGGGDRCQWYAFGPKNPCDQTVTCPPDHVTKRSHAPDQTVKPCDQTVACNKGAVDKPVKLPVKGDFSQKGGLSAKAHSTAIQRGDLALLRRVGVDKGVAKAIVYDQQVGSDDIRQAIENALAKEWVSSQNEGSWKCEPGYIVETINTAVREGHAVWQSRNFTRMKKAIKPKIVRPKRAMTVAEFQARKQKISADLAAVK